MKVYNKVSVSKNGEDDYLHEWNKVVKVLEDNGMTWSKNLEETVESHYSEKEWCQYLSLSSVEITNEMYHNIMSVTKDLSNLLQDVVDKFYDLPLYRKYDILNKLNFSDFYKDLIVNSPKLKLFTYLCRFDLIYDEISKQFKCIEFNSDTPLGLIESGMCHSVVNDYNNKFIYNTIEFDLVQMWNSIRKELNLTKDDIIYFSSLGENVEGRLTVEYNRLHSEADGKSQFIALEDIIITDDGLFTENGENIKYWYRLYPLEFWENEVNNLGYKLSELIKDEKLIIINPVYSFLIQNKSFYAYIYSHLNNNDLNLKESSLKTIKNNILPTYLNKEDASYLKDYVVKPIYGREGNCVDIYKNNELYFKDMKHVDTEYYDTQDKIYQQYIEMPKVEIETWNGSYMGNLLIGSYLIGGQSSGLYLRIGHEVTNPLSLLASYHIENKEVK